MASASSTAPAVTTSQGKARLRLCAPVRDRPSVLRRCIRSPESFRSAHFFSNTFWFRTRPRSAARRPMRARSAFWRVCRWYFFSSCSASGCRFCSTRSTASTSGIAATETWSRIPGPATGCTPRSAGPAASLSPTSSGTPTRCALPESICTRIRSVVRQGADRSFPDSVLPVLRGRTDRGFVALRLRHLAVLREVGHRFRREGAEAFSGRLPRPSSSC